MKVFQINWSSFGSTGILALSIHNALLENGDDAYFAYGWGRKKVEKSMRIGNGISIRIHERLARYTGLIGWFSTFDTFCLLRKIKNEKPDIVHLHNIHDNYVCVPLLLKFLAKQNIQVVITLHDCWPFTGKCPHFTIAKCYKWKEECGNCPQLNLFPKIRYFDTSRLLLKQKKKLWGNIKHLYVTTVSEWLKDTSCQSFFGQRDVTVILNGIDINIFCVKNNINRQVLGLPENKKIILGIATTWGKGKGLDKWLQLRYLLDDVYIIVLIGLRPQQIAELPKGILGIVRTESKEILADYYNAADVYVNMSLEETFGLPTAEAMACGTPAIVFNSTANTEMIHDRTGIVVDDFSTIEMMKAIINVTSHPKIEYTINCRKCAETYYSDSSMSRKYIELYQCDK